MRLSREVGNSGIKRFSTLSVHSLYFFLTAIRAINPLSPKSDQLQISPYRVIKGKGNEKQGHDQIEIAVIFNRFT